MAHILTMTAEESGSLSAAEIVGWVLDHNLSKSPEQKLITHPKVTEAMADLAGRSELAIKNQVRPFTQRCLTMVEITTPKPGRNETRHETLEKHQQDLAIIRLTREAEASALEISLLRWEDIVFEPDHTATLQLRLQEEATPQRKTTGRETAALLHQLKPQTTGTGPVFNLTKDQVNQRIKSAAANAGLGNKYSATSGPTGMLADLLAAGIIEHTEDYEQMTQDNILTYEKVINDKRDKDESPQA